MRERFAFIIKRYLFSVVYFQMSLLLKNIQWIYRYQ
uniref:Macaca fascicularis brain cDNA clone: QflA-17290, similar to human membrane cofactor protein (CD46, trophoblast-lymphocytecross-reactive antigen) (MCP), transcript variant a, mRNA, RefSeq: NM_002389.3 n=1 Tax=Macaca fascicularis TaxID=9541 RepID=I7GL96_MACFA|nr:unnamed protein product [Macaca fascicularis]